MVLTYAPIFNTLNLTSANGIRISNIQDVPIVEARFRTRLGGDSSLLIRDQFNGRRITLRGTVSGTTYGDTRDKVDALMAELYKGRSILKMFTQTTPQDERRISCRLERSPNLTYVDNGLMNLVRFTIQLRAEDSTWERSDETSETFTVTSSPTTHVMAVTDGTAAAFPQINVTNAMSTDLTAITLHLTLLGAAGKSLVVQGLDLEGGQLLVFDFKNGRIGDGTVQAARPASLEGEWWQMNANVINSIQVVTNAGLTSPEGLTVQIIYRAQYWAL